jgi:predicted NBD/HSP70 family sugar kinase
MMGIPVAASGMPLVVCGDVGSTYTKVAVVNVATGRLVATAAHPTTIATDVLDGLAAALDAVASELPGADLSDPI